MKDTEQMAAMSLRDIVEYMANIQAQLKEAESVKTELQKHFDEIRQFHVPNALEDAGIRTATFEGIGRVQVTADMRVSQVPERREELYDWLRRSGAGDLIKPNVNASSLKSFIKELISEGVEVPEGMLNINPFERASITRV